MCHLAQLGSSASHTVTPITKIIEIKMINIMLATDMAGRAMSFLNQELSSTSLVYIVGDNLSRQAISPSLRLRSGELVWLLPTLHFRFKVVYRTEEVAIMIKIKRIYEDRSPDDGFRILIDRLWPRGISKEEAKFDIWIKEIAPSTELRHWFNHQPALFDEFRKKYFAELSTNPATAEIADILKKHDVVTFVYSAKDEADNNAVVLREYFQSKG